MSEEWEPIDHRPPLKRIETSPQYTPAPPSIAASIAYGIIYFVAAFVNWDIGWMRDVGMWSKQDRATWIYVMVIIPACVGAIAALFPS